MTIEETLIDRINDSDKSSSRAYKEVKNLPGREYLLRNCLPNFGTLWVFPLLLDLALIQIPCRTIRNSNILILILEK